MRKSATKRTSKVGPPPLDLVITAAVRDLQKAILTVNDLEAVSKLHARETVAEDRRERLVKARRDLLEARRGLDRVLVNEGEWGHEPARPSDFATSMNVRTGRRS